MSTSEKPKPIITGDSQAQGIAKFASRVTYEDLTHERRERLKVSVLDSLGCAINALGVPPIVACLEQAKQFGGSDARCTLIGGGKANVVYAAQYNTALVRYIDFVDSYLGGEELCHPSDNVGSVLAACEHAGRSGKEFLTALAVAYQVESALTSNAAFMADGFDLTTQLSFSIAAGACKALQLDEARSASAVEICGDVIPLLVVRTTPISQWKGLNSSQAALASIHGVFLASRGVTGPKYVIEGPNGLAQALGKSIQIDWDNVKLDCFDRLAAMRTQGQCQRRLLSIVDQDKLRRILERMLDENEFLSSYGIRALSKFHGNHPYIAHINGKEHRVDYEPGESRTGMFGGNSNWRGPIWFPVNFLLIESLQRYHHYFGDDVKVEFPTGSGEMLTLWDVAAELSRRLGNIFMRNGDGRRPVFGGVEKFQTDSRWRDLLLFHEYFHGDTGQGLGASHQTGWTALVAKLIQQNGQRRAEPGATTVAHGGT